MFQLENVLVRLKHEVLTRVACLAKENNISLDEFKRIAEEMIPGTIPKYRDTVAHERAVVVERAKLAAGFLPNGRKAEKLIDISKEEQILYVINEACDRCPTKKFEVTDACRNCIAHKCQSVCRFGAISYINGRAHIDSEKCRECGMCKKSCPYDAIAEDMRPCKRSCPTGAISYDPYDLCTKIDSNKCINCGECMAACPFGAIEDKSSIVPVINELMGNKNVYALVAPAITGQFGMNISYGKIKNAIKRLGFKDMIEAAFGADAVTVNESNEFVSRMNNGDNYMTTSCCPAFVNYINKYIPTEGKNISSTVSPMIASGRYIKSLDKDNIVVFIGPCVAKKREILGSSIKDAVDYVLTFEELIALFDAYKIELINCEDEKINSASVFGRGFGSASGVVKSIKNYIDSNNINVEFKPVNVSGIKEIKSTILIAKNGRLNGNFIEGMMCEGGCINGPAKIVNMQKSKSVFTKINNESETKNVSDDRTINEYSKLKMER